MSEETKDKTTDQIDEENLDTVKPGDEALPETRPDETVDDEHHGEDEHPRSKKARKQIRKLEEHIADLEAKLKDAKDQNLRLYAEFDNSRKRMIKDRLELLATASRDVIEAMLPALDDLDRGKETIQKAGDVAGAVEGFELISSKLKSILEQRGLKVMESVGQTFDPEMHDAVSEMEVQDESQRGKVIHEVAKGYYLNDRIIRHAKVVVGK